MKSLKFRKHLADLILKGSKTTTWRVFDDKGFSQQDIGKIISLKKWPDKAEFAQAKITEIYEKTFATIDNKDLEGHEKFDSKKQVYDTYSKYYNTEIKPKTKVLIIKFELINI